MNPVVRALGVFDMTISTFILFSTLFPATWLFTAGAYLVVKGGWFALLGNVISYLDVMIGVYLFLLSFGIGHGVLSIIAMLFLVQKGIVSMT